MRDKRTQKDVCGEASSRSLYLLFFAVSFSAMFLSDGTVISVSLQVELLLLLLLLLLVTF